MANLYKAMIRGAVVAQRLVSASNVRVAFARALLPDGRDRVVGLAAPPLARGDRIIIEIERLR